MVQEIRRLIFSHIETLSALKEDEETAKIHIPEGRIIRANYVGAASFAPQTPLTRPGYSKDIPAPVKPSEKAHTITLTLYDEFSFEQKYVNIAEAALCKALITYCRKNKIMIPKNAQKTLELTEFNFCLDINLDNTTESGGESLKFEE